MVQSDVAESVVMSAKKVKSNVTYENTEIDPYLCTCGPCKTFWRKAYGGKKGEQLLQRSVIQRAQDTSTLFKPEQQEWRIKIGDRVTVKGQYPGFVRYVGLIDENLIAPEVFVGVHLDDNIGSTHNGVFNGKRYFTCPRGHGAFVKYCDVFPLYPPVDRPPVTGNYMFPSYEEVRKQRAKRRLSLSDSGSGSSAGSYGRQFTNTRGRQLARVYYDENDMAYKDAEKREQIREKSMERTRKKLSTPKLTPQEKKYLKWKSDFGGDERADKMVKTLRQLHLGYQKGMELRYSYNSADDERPQSKDEPSTRPHTRPELMSSPTKK